MRSAIGTSFRTQCIGRLRLILGSKLYQTIPFKNDFDFIETKYWDVNEQIYFRIQIGNLDEDVVDMLTILIRILFAAKLGYHIQEVCAITLWKKIHCYLVDEVAILTWTAK